MKAPLSDRIQDLLSDRDGSKELMSGVIKGERTGSPFIRIGNKTFDIRRVTNKQK